jgi:hypothetical protein
MGGRRLITRDMMQAALIFRWSASQAAKHYGFSRNSIVAACERFGIVLPTTTFGKPIKAPKEPNHDEVYVDDAPKVKFSASKAAVERALDDIERRKRLQASG